MDKIGIYNTLGQSVESNFAFKQLDDALLRVECTPEITGQFILRIAGSDIQIPFTVIK
ncbi:MAG: hypothetical protein IPO27_12110 [Bacteroidetes bacterium]|nr:hypothetical protein [Bacteroidota bacterium]